MYGLTGHMKVAECISTDLGCLIQNSAATSTEKDELRNLQGNVEIVKGLLLAAKRNQQATRPALKVWLMHLRYVLCDAEDLVDLLSTRLRELATAGMFARVVKKVRHYYPSNFPKCICDREWIDEAKSVRRRLEEAANLSTSLNICLLTTAHSEGEVSAEIQSDNWDSEIDWSHWDGFTERAFGPGGLNNKPDNLVKIAKQIYGKIHLAEESAVLTLATVLRHKEETEVEWRSVLDELAAALEEQDADAITRISYNHLPSHLKLCCNYCVLFPYDYILPKDFLIQLWIANGFITQPPTSPTDHRSLEDVGYQYLVELVSGFFFETTERGYFGNIHSCKLTKFIYDLGKEEVGEDIICIDSTACGFHAGNHHVCLLNRRSPWVTPPSLLGAQKLRTFFMVGRSGPIDAALDTIFKSFKYLRVLDLHSVIRTETIPSSICELKLLRFIDLSHNPEKLLYLPESITKLINLQTLDLNQCTSLERLPRDLGKLLSLRCLDITSCDSLRIGAPDGRKKAALSQGLSQFRFNKARLESDRSWWKNRTDVLILEGFPKSRQLEQLSTSTRSSFGVKLHPDILVQAGQELSRMLQVLEIRNYDQQRIPIWELDHKRPISCLVKITIIDCRSCQRLLPFRYFPSLEVLVLRNIGALQYVDHCSRNGPLLLSSSFQRLKDLELSDLPNLRGWSRDLAALEHCQLNYHWTVTFPHLRSLIISRCPNLTSMPSVASVEHLQLNDVKEMLIKKLMTQRVGGPTQEAAAAGKDL